MFEEYLKQEGAENKIENNRRKKRLEETLAKVKIKKDKLPFFLTTARGPTQQSVEFIRWIRNNLFSSTSWVEAMGSLKQIYAVF
ncbi:MAG: hypothetical protein KKC46_17480 [Proteobacteria bacterium]|nr:hypothetical protein [Pseudomonadota bacterium]